MSEEKRDALDESQLDKVAGGIGGAKQMSWKEPGWTSRKPVDPGKNRGKPLLSKKK